jgi:uncharacterized delta-60 repeat protein
LALTGPGIASALGLRAGGVVIPRRPTQPELIVKRPTPWRPTRRRPSARPRLEALEDRCLLSAGQLDPTFGAGGIVTTDVGGPTQDLARDLVVSQPDGKVILVGTSGSGTATQMVALRYNSDGSLDTTFGIGGKATTPLTLAPTAVALDAAGRILVAGSTGGFPADFVVVRLNADGSLDSTFGSGGRVVIAVGGFSDRAAQAVAVDAAGRIVLAGSAFGDSDFALVRLEADGSLDTSFGSGGEVILPFGGVCAATGVAIDSAGRIVVAGTNNITGPISPDDALPDFAVARLNADGSLDTSFGSGGKTTINLGGSTPSANNATGVALDSSGRIVVFGTTDPEDGQDDFAAVRLRTDGSVDITFGTGGVTTLNFGTAGGRGTEDVPTSLAINSDGSIALAGYTGSAVGAGNVDFAVALLDPNGCPDPDFGLGGKVTTHFPTGALTSIDRAAGVAFDQAGRLIVAGTVDSSGPTGSDFAVVRYLGHDSVVDAGSPTLAADLQSAVTALGAGTPLGTPRVVVSVTDPSQMPAVASALAGLTATPSGPVVEVLLDVGPGSYSLGNVSVPAGLKLVLDGDGGACGAGTFVAGAAPALTVLSGDVVIRDGASFTGSGTAAGLVVQGGQVDAQGSTFTGAGSAPAILVQGGQFSIEDSTLNATGSGALIRLTGPNDVTASGDTFEVNGTPLADNYQIEDVIDHSLDGLGGGTVFWVPDNVFVSTTIGSVQRGVNVVPDGYTVNVETGVKGDYSVGARSLTIAYQSRQTVTQQADSLDGTKLSLVVWDFGGGDSVKFVAGSNPGAVQLTINNLPRGTFLPTGRLIAYVQGSGDDVQVDSALTLSAWLYGDGGNDRLKGGGGNNVLLGDGGGDLLVGGPGRNILIGLGADRLVSNGGQDILIAGSTTFDGDEVALAAILAEWSSADSLAARVANLTGNTASPYFSAARLNGNYFLLDGGPNQTVSNDFSADTVAAGSGPGLVFAGSTDKLSGLTASDVAFIFGF